MKEKVKETITDSEKDNYEIVDVKRQNIVSGKNINDLWQVSFAKIYNGNYDKTNYSTISFAVVNNNLVIYTITGKNDNNFEDNPIIISKEEAIEIAKNKEKEFSKPKDGNLETVKSQYNKKYYIDTTTGEIIGGEQSEFFND